MAIPVAAGDNIRMILKGTYNTSVTLNNVFYAKVNTEAPGALESTLQHAANGLWKTIQSSLLAVTNTIVVYSEVLAESLDADGNLVNGESYFIPAGEGQGTSTGGALPPADAFTFKIVRPDSSKRHGFKRFAGVSESEQDAGVPAAGTVTALDALAAAMAGDIHFWGDVLGVNSDLGGQMNIQLVQKVLNGDVVSPAVFYFPATVVFDKIGHQDTRDYGRGV
jgi:hypothetical protein